MSSTKRIESSASTLVHRTSCFTCLRPAVACLCARLKPFESNPELVLLIHPRESRKAIGTARLTHLSISNSRLIRGEGEDFDQDTRIQDLIEDPSFRSVVLFPGPSATSLDGTEGELQPLRDEGRKLRVFVIDGTWSEARKMIQRSQRLSRLPQVMFEPREPSNYRIRKQPKPVCVSTLEAVHALLERLASCGLGCLPENRAHDHLLRVFDEMVTFQLRHVQPPRNPRTARAD